MNYLTTYSMDDNVIYVYEDGSWVSFDDAYFEIQYNTGYIETVVPSYCTNIDAFAKQFAEDNKGCFPEVYIYD